ncbi:MafI family immunity protein [Citrobacter sp. Cs237]|uniref:MafI family immunity protein n=1 Tax=Citrobacter TaxID=544 RepID=UPI0025764C71|nr:MafI family immunity protein [Citrobacter sp. Cs237]EHG7610646.1 MafI family immunity protein [Citrobacter sedlakii]MDM2750676.1 MafI family immunity protein [Citrobacter sp. Cs237]HBU8851131.1 MafI family immunity protein [Citrobacter sedlakii]
MGINDEIREFGEGLKDRLEPSLVDFALGYLGFSENILAFETLCDHITDYDVVISKDEYTQVIKIVNYLGLEIVSRYTYINPEK